MKMSLTSMILQKLSRDSLEWFYPTLSSMKLLPSDGSLRIGCRDISTMTSINVLDTLQRIEFIFDDDVGDYYRGRWMTFVNTTSDSLVKLGSCLPKTIALTVCDYPIIVWFDLTNIVLKWVIVSEDLSNFDEVIVRQCPSLQVDVRFSDFSRTETIRL